MKNKYEEKSRLYLLNNLNKNLVIENESLVFLVNEVPYEALYEASFESADTKEASYEAFMKLHWLEI